MNRRFFAKLLALSAGSLPFLSLGAQPATAEESAGEPNSGGNDSQTGASGPGGAREPVNIEDMT